MRLHNQHRGIPQVQLPDHLVVVGGVQPALGHPKTDMLRAHVQLLGHPVPDGEQVFIGVAVELELRLLLVRVDGKEDVVAMETRPVGWGHARAVV